MKRILCSILAFTLACGIISPNYVEAQSEKISVEAGSLPFSDIEEGLWYYDSVKEAYELGLMQADGGKDLFNPNGNLTRGMVATVLYRMDGTNEKVSFTNKFNDVKEGVWYSDAIIWTSKHNIVSGYKNGNFGPDDKITRQDLCIMLYNYATYKNLDTSKKADLSKYEDYKAITSYAKTAVSWAVANGIIGGSSKLNPTGNATRAEASKMFVLTSKVRTNISTEVINKVIENVESMDMSIITEQCKEALEQAIVQARAVLENPKSTQAEVDLALTRIQNILNNVEMIGDKTELIELINSVKDFDITIITPDSADKLTSVLNAAIDVENSQNATQSIIDDMIKQIKDMLDELEYKDANYTKVDDAINVANSLNKDLYKDFSEVEKAIKAVVRGYDITKQEEVDKMAKAIVEAIDALVYKDANYEVINKAIDKANALDKTLYQNYDVVEKAIAKVIENLDITKQEEVNKMAKAINDAIEALVYKDADYSKVDEALDNAKVYTENKDLYINYDVLEKAINAVVRDYNITKQEEVDNMAKAINDAIKALVYKDADYSKVYAAINAANELDKNLYIDFSAVEEAIKSVVRDYNITKQEEVDKMAKAINDAIDALVYKDADYSKVDAALDISKTYTENKDLYINYDVLETAINEVVRDYNITKQEEVDNMAKAINDAIKALVYKIADYREVDNAIAIANNLHKELYKDFSEVEVAIDAVIFDYDITKQEEVDNMAKAINDAIDALEYKDGDYTEVDAAKEEANGLDKLLYESFDAVEEAINSIVEGLNITEQERVDAMAKAIKDAINALVYKGADYTKVDKALNKVKQYEKHKDLFTNYDVLQKAIDAVIRGYNITQQAEVDKMAQDINNAIDALMVEKAYMKRHSFVNELGNYNNVTKVVFTDIKPTGIEDSKIINLGKNFYREVVGWIDGDTYYVSSCIEGVKIMAPDYFLSMFQFCSRLKEVYFSNLDISNISITGSFYYSSPKLFDLNLSEATKLINIDGLYSYTREEKVDFNDLDTSKIQDMSRLMYCSEVLKYVDLSNIDTSSVIKAIGWFGDSNRIEYIDFTNAKLGNLSPDTFKFLMLDNVTINLTNASLPFGYTIEELFPGYNDTWTIIGTPKIDYVKINKLIELANSLDPSVYEGFDKLEKAINSVVYDMDYANNKDLLNNLNEIRDAIDNLVFRKTNYAQIDEIISIMDGFKKTEFSIEENKILEDAVAKVLKDCDNLNENEINLRVKELRNAYGEFSSLTIELEQINRDLLLQRKDIKKIVFTDRKPNLTIATDICNSLGNIENTIFGWVEGDTYYISTYMEGVKVYSKKMANYFAGLKYIEDIDFSNFDTSKTTDMNFMFRNCYAIKHLDLSNFNTSNVKSMWSMFQMDSSDEAITSLKSIDLSSFDTSNVTDMSQMFCGCTNLEELNFSSFDFSNVEIASFMFEGCNSLKSLDLSNKDFGKVELFFEMFAGVNNLRYLDLSNSNLRNITKDTFDDFRPKSLKLLLNNAILPNDFTPESYMEGYNDRWIINDYDAILDGEYWEIEHLIKLSSTLEKDLYENYAAVEEAINDVVYGYKYDRQDEIDAFANNIETAINNLVYRKTAHPEINEYLEKYDTVSKTDLTIDVVGFIDEEIKNVINNFDSLTQKEFDSKVKLLKVVYNRNSLTAITDSFEVKFSLLLNDKYNIRNIVFTNHKPASNEGIEFDVFNYIEDDLVGWVDGDTYYVASNYDGTTVVAPNNCKQMFSDLNYVENIDLTYFDTSKVENMSCMFDSSNRLRNINMSNIDTSNVTDMSCMFRECNNLKELNISDFDTSNVTNMREMFFGCRLAEIDVSNFDTSKVTTMAGMFGECGNLKKIDVSNFDTSKVTTMAGMFMSSGITEIDVSNFDTSNLVILAHTFSYCYNLESIDITNFDTSKIKSVSCLFQDCRKLKTIDLSNFDTSNMTDMSYLFAGCSGLISLDVSKFDTSKVTDMSYLFAGCSGLISLDVSKFDTSNVTDMSHLFAGCSGLISLDLSNFDTSKVTDMSGMFSSCYKLKSLDLSMLDTSHLQTANLMFNGLENLEYLDLRNFNTKLVRCENEEFFWFMDVYNKLKYIDFENADLSGVWKNSILIKETDQLTINVKNATFKEGKDLKDYMVGDNLDSITMVN